MELEGYTLMRARETREGDAIGFRLPGAGYVVESVETDNLGNIRHRFNDDTGSASYHPGEWLYIKRPTHTPGPWAHSEDMAGEIIAPSGVAICAVYGDQARAYECDLNQSLIAAAPELLEALQLAYRHLNGGSDSLTPMEFDRAFKLARAAIAKATGGAP